MVEKSDPGQAHGDNLSSADERIARIRKLAIATFEDTPRAERWLHRPLSELANNAPIDLLVTDDGARLVENILAKIAWGAAF